MDPSQSKSRTDLLRTRIMPELKEVFPRYRDRDESQTIDEPKMQRRPTLQLAACAWRGVSRADPCHRVPRACSVIGVDERRRRIEPREMREGALAAGL